MNILNDNDIDYLSSVVKKIKFDVNQPKRRASQGF